MTRETSCYGLSIQTRDKEKELSESETSINRLTRNTKTLKNRVEMTDGQTISWIFLSTALASQKEQADFNSISNIADGINHAIPTHKELQTSLAWLTKNGLVIKVGSKYGLTEKGKLEYMESSKNTSTLLKIWDNVESVLKKYGT